MAKFSEDPQGGSTKNMSMFFYLKEDPGNELEVGQQEHKRPFELIFGKISHHSIYYILNVVLVWMFSSFHISALLLILAGGIFSSFSLAVHISLDISTFSCLVILARRKLTLKFGFNASGSFVFSLGIV